MEVWLSVDSFHLEPRFNRDSRYSIIRAVFKCRCSSGHGCPDLLRFVAIEYPLFLLRQSWSLEFIGKVIVVKNFSSKVTLQVVVISRKMMSNNFYLYRILEHYRIMKTILFLISIVSPWFRRRSNSGIRMEVWLSVDSFHLEPRFNRDSRYSIIYVLSPSVAARLDMVVRIYFASSRSNTRCFFFDRIDR